MPGPGALANGRPYIDVPSGVQTLPQYQDISDTGSITFAVVASAIRLQFTNMTDVVFSLLNDTLYLLADNGAETSEVRRIIRTEKIEGTPDTYFVIVESPFTVAAASYDLKIADPADIQYTNTVVAGTEGVFVDGVEKIDAGQAVTFNPAQPFRPLVLFSDYPYKLSNGTFFFDGGAGDGVQSVAALNASIEVDNTDPLNPVVGFPYLVFRALLTQAGTNAPTAIILENTLGEIPTYDYKNVGQYSILSAGNLFVQNKCFVTFTAGGLDTADAYAAAYKWDNIGEILLSSSRNGALQDDVLVVASLEILVYP